MAKYSVCLTTVSTLKDAEKIATALLDKKLIACANIVPGIISIYHWKKKRCREGEILLILKTVSSKTKRLEDALRRIHPYELAEFIALPITRGSRSYLKWIFEETRGS